MLNGLRTAHPAAPFAPVPPDVTAASVITALCSVAGAILLALTALYWRRLPVLSPGGSGPPYRPGARGHEPGRGLTAASRRFQSGVINDYITWLVTGVAALGGILALIIR